MQVFLLSFETKQAACESALAIERDHLRFANLTKIGKGCSLRTDTCDLWWFEGEFDFFTFDDVRIPFTDDVEHAGE